VCRDRQSLNKSENQASDAPDRLGERNKPNNFIVATFFLNGMTRDAMPIAENIHISEEGSRQKAE
jgi:hypothetical protein